MMNKGILLFLSSLFLGATHILAQGDANPAPLSGNSGAASKLAAIPTNYYTGIPSIGVPLYQYSHHNGLSLSVSLNYFAGGIRVNEQPSTAGLGWYLSAGGVITRTVSGMPDDVPTNGYMYSPALPLDYRPNGMKYYYDSVDAEQDVFQFNFNGRSGKFFIGKNKQVVVVPLSKMQVKYIAAGSNGMITSFVIVTEDGVKYIFSERETKVPFGYPSHESGYNGINYTTAWYLSQMIAPMGTDTIRFNYNTKQEQNATDGLVFNQTGIISNGNLFKTFDAHGDYIDTIKKIASIVFPDKKTITFLYDKKILYDGQDSILNKIKISDSVFRYGYLLSWNSSKRNYLTAINYYTANASKNLYQFTYKNPLFPAYSVHTLHPTVDTLSNKTDYWGFYNGAPNGTNAIPAVAGIYTGGANRQPSDTLCLASSLASVQDPAGGITYYTFEANDALPYTVSDQVVNINSLAASTNTISINQVFGNETAITLGFDASVSRVGASPFSGTCNITCTLKSMDGATTYATLVKNLSELFYVGGLVWKVNVANGSYKLSTAISTCTGTPTNIPLNFSWKNQATTGTSVFAGGIRIKQVVHYDPYTEKRYDTLATYRYVTTDGKSSGFLSAIPKYDYNYSQTVINGGTTTTAYTYISSNPVNTLSYTQGSSVGYSRVEVINGSTGNNIGKTVYEFTSLKDINSNLVTPAFPYVPNEQPEWALGLPKRIAVYDNAGNLKKVTTDSFSTTSIDLGNANFQSLKLGRLAATYYGDPNISNTPHTDYYTGLFYYPVAGRTDLARSIDSVYNPDGSLQVQQRSILYDTNYNVIKMTSPYDKTRGLLQETRIYYPYNYTITGAIGKLRDSGIVSAPISKETWITGDATPRLVSASITDYQQLPSGHIKPSTVYALESNAPVSKAIIDTFNATSLIRNTTYLKPQQSFTAYDKNGNLLESKSPVSGIYSSVILDYNNQFTIAQVSNAKLTDVAYTSFESDSTGRWTVSSTLRTDTIGLTGKKSYNLSNGNITRSGLTSTQSYIVSVWARTGASISVNSVALSGSIAVQDGWNLFTKTLTGITTLTISGTGIIDELRLMPKDANMTTATFEPMVGMTSAADANNTVAYTTYDELNRTKLLLDKDKNIIKKYQYSDSTNLLGSDSVWQTQSTSCASTQLTTKQKDVNPYSDTYDSIRNVITTDCVTCPVTCSQTGNRKRVGCNCEFGIRSNLSSVRTKVNGVFVWVCTYMYCFSDGTASTTYTENNSSACTVDGFCAIN